MMSKSGDLIDAPERGLWWRDDGTMKLFVVFNVDELIVL